VTRLFFAIWPEPAAARELERVGQELARLAGGKPVPADKIHITLAFLGSLGLDGVGAAVLAAARVKGAAIRMDLDRVGSFRRARVGWAAPSRPSAELLALQAALAGELRLRTFRLEDREFNPHATLARKVAKAIPAGPIETVEWRSRAFTLVESTGDGRYEVRESWGLR